MGFALGMFETESGFAVSHQYDRAPSIIRPGDPVTLRVRTIHGYDAVDAYMLDGAGPFSLAESQQLTSFSPAVGQCFLR